MSTFSAKPALVEHDWYVIDATDLILGRMSTKIATYLRGKHKPIYTPNQDTGDNVIVINAEKIRVTGNKAKDKKYYHHTGYPGGIKETNFEKLNAEHPARVIELAVKRMLPRNPLGRAMYRKLRVYAGPEHPHVAQQPKVLEITD